MCVLERRRQLSRHDPAAADGVRDEPHPVSVVAGGPWLHPRGPGALDDGLAVLARHLFREAADEDAPADAMYGVDMVPRR
jgi:hypothetical protein